MSSDIAQRPLGTKPPLIENCQGRRNEVKEHQANFCTIKMQTIYRKAELGVELSWLCWALFRSCGVSLWRCWEDSLDTWLYSPTKILELKGGLEMDSETSIVFVHLQRRTLFSWVGDRKPFQYVLLSNHKLRTLYKFIPERELNFHLNYFNSRCVFLTTWWFQNYFCHHP